MEAMTRELEGWRKEAEGKEQELREEFKWSVDMMEAEFRKVLVTN